MELNIRIKLWALNRQNLVIKNSFNYFFDSFWILRIERYNLLSHKSHKWVIFIANIGHTGLLTALELHGCMCVTNNLCVKVGS